MIGATGATGHPTSIGAATAGRCQTIATALRQWGYDPAAAERARARPNRRSLSDLTIPPLPAEIMNLKIP